jgi:hypothetical protein
MIDVKGKGPMRTYFLVASVNATAAGAALGRDPL